MYVVVVEFAVVPAFASRFLDAIVANARASRGHEPGCLQFDVCVAEGDAPLVFLYEVYRDRAAFDAHVATPHFRTFDAVSAPWVARKSVRVFERMDPS